ncbi:MAG TPA: STAS domain-containing protein [Blastocatellia bacterium]|nr:STAS domain-containing protein [Blastocatellia bacterium]
MSTADIRSKLVGEAAVIYPGPYLNQLRGERIERHCLDLLARGIRNLVINFEETELVNSIGISLLLEAIDAVDEANGKVVLASLNTTNRELLEVLGILSKVEVAINEDAALTAFAGLTTAGGVML